MTNICSVCSVLCVAVGCCFFCVVCCWCDVKSVHTVYNIQCVNFCVNKTISDFNFCGDCKEYNGVCLTDMFNRHDNMK